MQVGSYSLAYSSMQSMHLAFSQAGSAAGIASTPSNSSSPDSKVSLSTNGLAASAADVKQHGKDVSPATSILKHVLKQMFGIDVDLVDVQQLHAETNDSVNAASASISADSAQGNSQSASALLYQEDYSAAFSMSGTLTTKDGHKLSFSLDFSMESHVSYAGVQASNHGGQQQFTLGNDAGSLSGSSVLAALTQLIQPAADSANSNSTAQSTMAKDAISLLAHFKLWPDDSPSSLLAQHKLLMNVLPKPVDPLAVPPEPKAEAGATVDVSV